MNYYGEKLKLDKPTMDEGMQKLIAVSIPFTKAMKKLMNVYAGAIETGDLMLATSTLAVMANMLEEVGAAHSIFCAIAYEDYEDQMSAANDRLEDAMRNA